MGSSPLGEWSLMETFRPPETLRPRAFRHENSLKNPAAGHRPAAMPLYPQLSTKKAGAGAFADCNGRAMATEL